MIEQRKEFSAAQTFPIFPFAIPIMTFPIYAELRKSVQAED